eukprot:COSAG04_NODE_10503_length_772_cov_1.509658_2_plen_79_part_01
MTHSAPPAHHLPSRLRAAASQIWSDLCFVAVCRAIQKKVGYAFGAGMHGVSFWTADVLYGAGGADSADARAMWRAATPP